MGLELSSYQAFSKALGAARDVNLAAYTLGEGTTERALVVAAEHGAAVRVRLAGTVYDDPHGALALHNAHEAAYLAEHGVDAAVSDAKALHIKAAVIDGQAFFDDRNWCGDDDLLIHSDVAEDISSTTAALAGATVPPVPDGLTFTKGEALAEEAKLLAGGSDTVALQTETLGPSIITTLLQAAAAHAGVRVMLKRESGHMSARNAKAIATLQAHGVLVRTTTGNDKFCIAGEHGWIGSANASGGDPRMSDWGVPVDDPQSIEQLRRRFESLWEKAKASAPLRT